MFRGNDALAGSIRIEFFQHNILVGYRGTLVYVMSSSKIIRMDLVSGSFVDHFSQNLARIVSIVNIRC